MQYNTHMTLKFRKCLEIGCHYRNTIMSYPECDQAQILMVDPIQEWLDRVPDSDRVIKRRAAITARGGGERDFWYIDEATRIRLGLPDWATTMGSLGPDHETVRHFRWLEHQRRVRVPVVALADLIDQHDWWDMDYLQVDTEGWDHEILMALLETPCRPTVIRFESKLLGPGEMLTLIPRFRAEGYQVAQGRERDFRGVNYNTVLHKGPVPAGIL